MRKPEKDVPSELTPPWKLPVTHTNTKTPHINTHLNTHMLKDGFPLITERFKTKLRLTQRTRFMQIPPHPQKHNPNKDQCSRWRTSIQKHWKNKPEKKNDSMWSRHKQPNTCKEKKTFAANIEEVKYCGQKPAMICGSSVLAGCWALKGGEVVLLVHHLWNANPAGYQPAFWKSFLPTHIHPSRKRVLFIYNRTVCLKTSNISSKPFISIRTETSLLPSLWQQSQEGLPKRCNVLVPAIDWQNSVFHQIYLRI